MNPLLPAAVCFVDGDVAGFGRVDLRISGPRVIGVGVPPQRDDVVVELHGDRVLPGLINAHDHLQLNNFPRVKFRDAHLNVEEWIADVAARRAHDARLARAREVPREARLLQGAFKNLLAGVTTVAHHDPLYPALRAPHFPVRVLGDYGWAHRSVSKAKPACSARITRRPPNGRGSSMRAKEWMPPPRGNSAVSNRWIV